MTHEQLVVFASAAETLNFSETARRLYLAQPTVSQQIKSLERQLGVLLFERRGRGLALTPAGEALQAHAAVVRRELEAAEGTLAGFRGELVGPLRVGASTTIGDYWLPEHLVAFKAAHQRVAVSLAISNSSAMLHGLQRGELHLVLTEGRRPAGLGDRWEASQAFEDRLVVIAGPTCDVGAEPGWAELVACPWVLREPGSGTREVLADAIARQGLAVADLRVALELGSTQAIMRAVRAGAGLACVSLMAVRDELAAGRLRELTPPGPPLARPWWLVRPRGRALAPTARALIAWLERVAGASADPPVGSGRPEIPRRSGEPC